MKTTSKSMFETSNAFSMDRFVVEKKGLNRRQVELKRFCDRMPDMSPALIASKMSHIKTEDLYETYELIDKNARNFAAYWHWLFIPKDTKR